MLQERRAAARAHAEQLARKIASADPTVRRIWGFGSTFDVRLRFREYSDIDLAVDGGELPPGRSVSDREGKASDTEMATMARGTY